jgi:hypothetical protein
VYDVDANKIVYAVVAQIMDASCMDHPSNIYLIIQIIQGEEYKLPTVFVEIGNVWFILRELNCKD